MDAGSAGEKNHRAFVAVHAADSTGRSTYSRSDCAAKLIAQARLPDVPVRYWRTKGGREIDFVLARRRGQVDAIEA